MRNNKKERWPLTATTARLPGLVQSVTCRELGCRELGCRELAPYLRLRSKSYFNPGNETHINDKKTLQDFLDKHGGWFNDELIDGREISEVLGDLSV